MISSDAKKILNCLEAIKEAIDNPNMAQPEKDAVTREIVDRIKIINDKYVIQNKRELLMEYENYTNLVVLGKKNPRISKQLVDDFLNNNKI